MTNAQDTFERQFGDLTVRIDRDLCIGSGNCVKVAPEVFVLDDERLSSFRADAQEIDGERLIEACDVCPVSALFVFDADGEQIVPRLERY